LYIVADLFLGQLLVKIQVSPSGILINKNEKSISKKRAVDSENGQKRICKSFDDAFKVQVVQFTLQVNNFNLLQSRQTAIFIFDKNTLQYLYFP
jgi:hypothetical protein